MSEQNQLTELLLAKQTKKQRRKWIIKTVFPLLMYIKLQTLAQLQANNAGMMKNWKEQADAPVMFRFWIFLSQNWFLSGSARQWKGGEHVFIAWVIHSDWAGLRVLAVFSRPAGRQSLLGAGDRPKWQGHGPWSWDDWMRRGGESSLPSRDHRRGVVVIDHATVGRGVWAAAGRRGTPLVFDLQPGLAQRLGEVVVHRASDGHRVGGGGLGLLVVLPKAATEMFLDDRVAGRVGWKKSSSRLPIW